MPHVPLQPESPCNLLAVTNNLRVSGAPEGRCTAR